MSIELPEATILAAQMDKELQGKRIESCNIEDYERMQKVGFINEDIDDFHRVIGGLIQSVTSKGNLIQLKLDNGMNLLLGPEYGGKFFYHRTEQDIPKKTHICIRFEDKTYFSGRQTNMGMIIAIHEDQLQQNFLYRREHSGAPSPLDEEFTCDRFSELIKDKTRQIKSVLVGKDAVLIGLSNSAFQDVIYRAKIHPKRRASDLDENERKTLFEAINALVKERIDLGGKNKFLNLYGDPGRYIPVMGPNMKEKQCPECATTIEKMAIGGGHVFFCPECQRET